MRRPLGTLAFVLILALSKSDVLGQAPQPAPVPAPAAQAVSQPRASGVVPLQLQVVLVRTQGDKRISSLPYTISMSWTATPPASLGPLRPAGNSARIRMNAQVPT